MPLPLAEDATPPEAARLLRWLRRLVTGLAVVMGGGVIALVALLWLRLAPAPPALPSAIALPDGARAAAVTYAKDFTVIVTEAGEILLYDSAGRLRQRVSPQP